MKYSIRYLHDDTYDHNGEHQEIETECECNYFTTNIKVDKKNKMLICDDCGFEQELPDDYDRDLEDEDIINYWELI